jgi:hypothetical protein
VIGRKSQNSRQIHGRAWSRSAGMAVLAFDRTSALSVTVARNAHLSSHDLLHHIDICLAVGSNRRHAPSDERGSLPSPRRTLRPGQSEI